MSDENVCEILKGMDIRDFIKTASEEQIRLLSQVAISTKKKVKIKIEEANRNPDVKYSADENDAFTLRLGRLYNYLSMVEAVSQNAIADFNHKRKMENKRNACAAEKLKLLRRAISEHCPEDIRRKIFAAYDKAEARIENKFFPESEVAE